MQKIQVQTNDSSKIMRLQLADEGLSESRFMRGFKAVSTGGASELVRKRGGNKTVQRPCSCENENKVIATLATRLRKMQKKYEPTKRITLNPRTGVATIERQETGLLADLSKIVGGVIGATPYGAAAKGVLSVGKSIFGGKKGKSASGASGGGDAATAQRMALLQGENANLKKVIASGQEMLKKQKAELTKTKLIYGGTGFVAGAGLGYILKRSRTA
jgi:hypothetical protein